MLYLEWLKIFSELPFILYAMQSNNKTFKHIKRNFDLIK